MFNIFNSKPTLAELIPKGFIDIHSHILPGIDDGAKNINESLSLISKMKEIGFSKIIGTPHTYEGVYNNTNETIINSFNVLKKELNTEIEIDYSSEYMLDNSLIEKLKNKTILCLKNNYILVEMSYISSPIDLYEILFQIQLNGYTPILAHPERYRFLHNNIKEYYKLKNAGCYFQINLLSITGYYGKDILRISNKLLKDKLVDYVGSDIHNQRHLDFFKRKVLTSEVGQLKKAIESNNKFK